MLEIICAKCRKNLRVEDKQMGKWIKCPSCKFETPVAAKKTATCPECSGQNTLHQVHRRYHVICGHCTQKFVNPHADGDSHIITQLDSIHSTLKTIKYVLVFWFVLYIASITAN